MKRVVMCIFLILFIANPALSDELSDESDKTLSPYFLVISEDSDLDQLPLKSTSASVNIAGVIADVVVSQIYKNEGEHTLEAIYVFPASTRAAVYGMIMTIGDRTIVAEIQKKEEARETYEKAKEEGKSASLLEQQRPNVFQMNVANIMPGDEIQVELRYTELLVPTDSIYEFVYPTVVSPRYSNTPIAEATSSEEWVVNPYLHEGEAPSYTFDIQVDISAGLPIQQVLCDTHETNIQYEGKSFAVIRLGESEQFGGNRDFILKYQLAGGAIESGVLLYEGEEENFFLLMVQPPEKVEQKDITPREYIFIVDVSGSMSGFPLEISKKLLKDLINNLRPEDRFNVLLFANSAAIMSEEGSLPATEENIQTAIDLIDRQRGGGGTEILRALIRALALPRSEGMSRIIVPVTDGFVTVEPEVFDLIRKNLGDANVFAFGIGSSVNRHIIEGMAHVGMGEPFVVTKQAEAAAQGEKFRRYIESPVLTQINVDFGEFGAYDIEPPSIPDVLAERPVICFGKWSGNPEGEIELTGFSGDEEYTKVFTVGDVQPSDKNSALRYLWARHRIMILGDYNKLSTDADIVNVITDLGLQYNLLTDYTSFVAVDTLVRNETGESTTVKQALPLSEGVSDYAVGTGSMSGAAARSSSFYNWSIGSGLPASAPSGYALTGGVGGGMSAVASSGFGMSVPGYTSTHIQSAPSISSSPGSVFNTSGISGPNTIFPSLVPLSQTQSLFNYIPISPVSLYNTAFTFPVRGGASQFPLSNPLTIFSVNTPAIFNQPFQSSLSLPNWGTSIIAPSMQTLGFNVILPATVGQGMVTGGLSIQKVTIVGDEKLENNVKNIITMNISKLSSCLQGIYMKGNLDVNIRIDVNGNVIFSEITRNDIGEAVGLCIINQLKNLKFWGLSTSSTLSVQVQFLIM
ncbi:MAG: VIT domain-containing protein [bacterium]